MNRKSAALPLLTVTAMLGTALVGCGSDVKTAASDTSIECAPSGSAVEGIKVTGDHGGTVEIDAKTPVTVKEQQSKVLDKGKGEALKEGSKANVHLTVFNGKDGELIGQQASGVSLLADQTPAWLGQALGCGTSDSRVVSVIPASTMWEDVSQSGVEGMKESDAVIAVLDSTGAEPGTLDPSELLKKAEGTPKEAPAGFPTVKLAENGEPTITMPKGENPPTKLEVATLIQGDGEEVKPGDRVYVNYKGVIWRTGEEFDSSWSRGAPTDFTTNGVIDGFKKALEGQKVGSQVIAVVPAEDGGYGAAGLEGMGHKPDDVMVFVLDILGTAHAE